MDVIFGEDKYIKSNSKTTSATFKLGNDITLIDSYNNQNKPDINDEAQNLSESLDINNRYKNYIDEIATNGIKESSPRSARELLKGRKGEQNNEIKSFVKEYKKELIKKENEGREANNRTR